MISDPENLAEVRKLWEVVIYRRDRIKRDTLAAAASGIGGYFPHYAADAAHNLPFVHACSALNEVLKQLRKEHVIRCGRRTLGALVDAGKNKLTWRNYSLIKEIVERRNKIAHEAALVPRGDCWRYIAEIETQLQDWGILEAD